MPFMKKKLTIILIAIVIFIPTIIAIVAYGVAVGNPVTKSSVFQMDMKDIDGKSYSFYKDSALNAKNDLNSNPINFFIEMNERAEKLSELPSALKGSPSYTIVYYSHNLQIAYNYYFSDNPKFAYYTNDKEQTFKIAEGDALEFVNSKYAIPLYKNAATPSLDVRGNIVLPQAMTWNYKTSSGDYNEAVVPLYSGKNEQEVSVSGSVQLHFDHDPDYLHATIMNGETVVFDDMYENIGTVSFDGLTRLNVAVEAKWYEGAGRESYGEATYRFITNIHAPAEFYLGASEVSPGDFIAITGKNVVDISSITFASEPSINFNPVFFQEGDYVVALVPISYDLTYSPAYTFTINCDGVESKLTLACANKKFPTRNYGIDASIIAYKRTPATLDAFNATLATVFADQVSTRYWSNQVPFIQPCLDGRQVKIGVGAYITLSATGTTYRHQGVDFIVAEGDQVMAACPGVVAYVGTLDLSGRTVVIDHGFGLKTLYAHMNSTSVSVGDVVNAGDIIGVVGETGFTQGIGLHFGTYVFDVPVRPYDALGWEKPGIPMILP